MLTQLEENGRSKSEQYWPAMGAEALSFGDLQVQTTSEDHMGYCLERTFLLVNPVSDQAREVRHWQFTTWPSSGEMGSGRDLVDLVERVEEYGKSKVVIPQEESIYGNQATITEQAILKQLKPTVVHCSAGVGRTGAYCASVICLQRMKEEQKMDLYQVTKHLRTQRPGMIQTPDQYMFVYRVVLDYLDMNDAPAIMTSDSLYSTPLSQPAFAETAYMAETSLSQAEGARVLSLNENSGPPPAL
jgi:protein tyrosine phosphatase